MKALVTGGSGFIGAALCRELVEAGHHVRVLDDDSRGRQSRLDELRENLEFVGGDVRDLSAVQQATAGVEVVWHLAYVNGTRFFYEQPDRVLEVGIKGTMNTIDAALEAGVRRYVLASTSETYNEPTHVPTTESERLMIPDVTNPRFSYGGGKIACELMTLHIAQQRGLETVIFRPHNIYGPDMGFEHVIPEIVARIVELSDGLKQKRVELPIQGDGSETRAFCFIDDAARGARLAGEKGHAGEIFHLGNPEEVSIRDLIARIGRVLEVDLTLIPGELRAGGTPRRCPSIDKLKTLGYQPVVNLDDGLIPTVRWYRDHFLSQRGDR